MLTVTETAERLKTSPGNVYALLDSGKLPRIATGAGGKGYRVLESDLEDFIKSNRTTAAPAEDHSIKRAKPRHLKV